MTIEQNLIEFWLQMFNEKGDSVIPAFVNCVLPKRIFLQRYKTLPPIEKMPENEKKEMKKYVIDLFPNKTIAEKMEACKII